jgi:formate C-acetyltransferase
MNERIQKLRDQSLNAVNRISPERAILVTEFYQSDLAQKVSTPIKRALAFKYILENKKICINDGELIVGERGPEPKATPTYPEICLHSLQDLEILDQRPKVSFKSDAETKTIYKEKIIPFWQGKTHRDKIFEALDQEWKNAYQAGIFTEFQEQRAPGHTVLGDKIYKNGLFDLKDEIEENIKNLDFHDDPRAIAKKDQLQAMDTAADALILFSQRHSQALKNLIKSEKDSSRKKELQEMANICEQVPANAPKTFYQALQYYWFIHLGVITELNPWDSFNPGRLDQHLYPFYKKGLEDGSLTKDKAIELLQSFWIKFNNHPSPPKIGVTAKESSTYTDFCLINVGGLKADGSNAVNELSYIILDVIEEMRLLQPSSMVQVSKKNPDNILKRAAKIVKTGFGQPSIFNTDAIIQELTRQGKSIEDARNGGASGCVEAGAFGTESYILTGYFNLVKIFEITLHDGLDPQSNEPVGLKTGNPSNFKTYRELLEAFRKQVRHFADIKVKGNNIIDHFFASELPVPFLSLLIDDCTLTAKDYNAGGARYNTSYIQGVGLGSLTDILTSIQYNVYDKKIITMDKMLKVLAEDFEGYDDIRNQLIFHTPKYGNDNDYADANAREIFEIFYNLLPTTSHVYFGSKVGATADGRKALQPLSEGISPVQGADIQGPTAVVKSAAKIDQLKTGGTLLNQKISPSMFENESGISKLVSLIRGYFRMDGHHIQFNVVTADTLRQAQKHPEKYRDLIVRVAGYSDYFNDLSEELQNEIINRSEQQL